MEACARSLLGGGGAGASFAQRRPLLSHAGGSLSGRRNARIRADDAQMYLALYRGADAEDSFDHFEEQRESNVEYLRSLPRSAGERRAMHNEAGEITLQQMLHEWTMHDLGHIRQIAELVRARKHWKAAGKLGESYQLRP